MLQIGISPTQRQYAPRGRRKRNGCCAAALRAFTAAKLYQRGEFKSLVTAANGCGSNPQYVKAALILKRTNNTVLVNDVLFGDRPLLAAAKAAERLAALIEAYRAASSSDLAQFGETVGGEEVFNSVVAPAL